MTGKRVGLVIGNNYPDSDEQLRFAVADALAMKEVLLNKDICGFDEVIDLVDRTSKEALVEVEKILKRADNNLVFIYFSGHGKKDFENDLCLVQEDVDTKMTMGFLLWNPMERKIPLIEFLVEKAGIVIPNFAFRLAISGEN